MTTTCIIVSSTAKTIVKMMTKSINNHLVFRSLSSLMGFHQKFVTTIVQFAVFVKTHVTET